MLQFTPLTLSDIPTVAPILHAYPNQICDFTVGGSFMWRDYFHTGYTVYEGSLILREEFSDGSAAYTYPIGPSVPQALAQLEAHCRDQGEDLIFCTVTEDQAAQITAAYPSYEMTEEEDWRDYLYDSQAFIELSGRKYSKLRNHIHQFERACPDYTFELLEDQNLAEARQFLLDFAAASSKATVTSLEENAKTLELLDHFGIYGLSGGLLKSAGQVLGFSICEIIGDVLFAHVEKADTRYPGVYQKLSNLTASTFASNQVQYINREEDVGDPGLRKSKEAYQPIRLLKKYTIRVMAP